MKLKFTLMLISFLYTSYCISQVKKISYLSETRTEDVNFDGSIDTQDVLKEYEAIKHGYTNSVYDVNFDGNIDTQDILKIYDYIKNGDQNLTSIYEYLAKDGHYRYFLRIIDDLVETETLSKNGRRTLFVADDEAFAKFFADNKWGVKNYNQLSENQKRMILYGSMLEKPYSVSMLSSVSNGIVEGECLRRYTLLQLLDTYSLISTNDPQLPNTSYWKNLAQTHDSIVLFKDGSGAAPMIHFLPEFLKNNKITSTDVDFLYNDPEGTHASDDAYINDCKVTIANILCTNGYIHKVNKVMLPLDNMAEVIRTKPQMSIFSSLLERFAAPFYDYTLTHRYNEIYGTKIDSCYEKCYFATRGSKSSGTTSTERSTDKDGNAAGAILKYDPGWNLYQPGSIVDASRDEVMEDMGCMIVPSDKALGNWWNNEGGKVLKDAYGTWENVPNKVVKEIIKNNQLMSFIASVPSKFNSVLNDAALKMGIEKTDVDSVFLACNGAVYQSNKVFAPRSYSSVMSPALVSENMSIIYNAISVLNYDACLNSMDNKFSIFLPVNSGMLTYIDPVSLGQAETHIWKFKYDPQGKTSYARIKAIVFKAEKQKDGSWLQTDSLKTITGSSKTDQVYDRLEDILDNIIVIGEIQQGKYYYQTKGKNYIKVGGQLNSEGLMTAAGGWQLDNNCPQIVSRIYNFENGKAYVVDKPLYTSYNSVSDILSSCEGVDKNGEQEFSKFLGVLKACNALSVNTSKNVNWSSTSKNGNLIYVPENSNESVSYLLNTFHYTMYIPTNKAMDEAFAKGLPTVDELNNTQDDELKAHIKQVMLNFVKYHIQDKAVFVDEGFDSGNYNSGRINPNTGRPYRLTVIPTSSGLTVKGTCTEAQEINKSKMYNKIAREYWLNNYKSESATLIETSSSVVMHAIDHPLLYKYREGSDLSLPENNQFVYSANDVYTYTESY